MAYVFAAGLDVLGVVDPLVVLGAWVTVTTLVDGAGVAVPSVDEQPAGATTTLAAAAVQQMRRNWFIRTS